MLYNDQKNTDKMDLESILMKNNSADDIIFLYDQFMDGISAEKNLLDLPANSWIRDQRKAVKLVKKTRVDSLLRFFADKKLFQAFYSRQTRLYQEILETLTWWGSMSLQALEQKIGKKITVRNNGSYIEPFLLIDSLPLLQLQISRYSYAGQISKEEVNAYLPAPLCKILKEVLPKPADYNIHPLLKIEKTAFNQSDEPSILTHLYRITEFIQHGYMGMRKDGKPSVKGLRDLAHIADLQDFFPAGSSKDLEMIKATILSSFFLACDLNKVVNTNEPQIILRDLFKSWLKKDTYFLMDHLLNHLRLGRGGYYYYDDYKPNRNIKEDLANILSTLETESWASIENIVNYCIFRQVNLLEVNIHSLEFQWVNKASYGSFSRWDNVDARLVAPIVYKPTLQAFFFLSTALGLTEIAYDIPVNNIFQQPKHEYLSKYDGLRYVRLTKLGAYVVGKTKKYSSTCLVQDKAVFVLDETRLVLTMEGDDPVATLTLETILEKIGAGRYIMTFDSLFKDCSNKREVQAKITLFRNIICKKPPKVWIDFFSKALTRVNPLAMESDYKIFKIENDEALLQLLSTDPKITPLILKVEGLRIAIKAINAGKLFALLRKHGYLISSKG